MPVGALSPHLLNKANQSVRRPDVYHSSSEKDPYRGDESAASKTDAGRETVAATSGHAFPLHYMEWIYEGIGPGPSSQCSPHPAAVRRLYYYLVVLCCSLCLKIKSRHCGDFPASFSQFRSWYLNVNEHRRSVVDHRRLSSIAVGSGFQPSPKPGHRVSLVYHAPQINKVDQSGRGLVM